MTLKILLCGEAPCGAWDAERISQALRTAVPELDLLDVETSFERVQGAGEARKASGASHFDLALVSLPQEGRDQLPSLKLCAPFVVAAIKDASFFKSAAAAGASEIVCAGEGFETRLDAVLQSYSRRLAIAKLSSDIGLRRELPFIAMLSHELKSPLATVEGYLRMMEARESGDAISNYDRMIKRSLLRLNAMHKLIGDIIDLARAESSGTSREMTRHELRAVCKEAVEPLLDAAGSRGISIDCQAPDGLSFNSAQGDLRAIISNLLSNAVKYNRSGGSVHLSLSQNAGILKIKVADTGIGMAPEELGRLSCEFARIRNSDTREIPGSGLGLSIVRRIASLYGGSLSIESKRGEGSSFIVELREAPSGQNKEL